MNLPASPIQTQSAASGCSGGRAVSMGGNICSLNIQDGGAEPVFILNAQGLKGAAVAAEPLVGDLRGPADLHGEQKRTGGGGVQMQIHDGQMISRGI